jgi:hypothetical protein
MPQIKREACANAAKLHHDRFSQAELVLRISSCEHHLGHHLQSLPVGYSLGTSQKPQANSDLHE